MDDTETLCLEGMRLHFIGVLGSGMRKLAKYAADCGADVSGSDVRHDPKIDELEEKGIDVTVGQKDSRLDTDIEMVVASQAIKTTNPEFSQARSMDAEVLRYPEFLGLMMEGHRGIAVAGTHGKSTTSSIMSYLMKEGGLDPSFIIGAQVPQLGGGSRCGDSRHMVVEACEYKRSFLYLEPTVGLVTNIDRDHMDYYRDMRELQGAFEDFAAEIRPDGQLLLNVDDPRVRELAEHTDAEVIPCSLEDDSCRYSADRIWRATRHTNFNVVYEGETVGRFQTSLYGTHNVLNSLMAIAACHEAGMSFETMQELIPNFEGVNRRFELLGEPWDVPVLSDYAHHPREIEATLAAVRQKYPDKRLFCVFQPHQHSRTRMMLNELADAFEGASKVLVADIYGARDSDHEKQQINGAHLVRSLRERDHEAVFMPDFEDIENKVVADVVPGDAVLVMGAGDVWKVADRIANGIDNKPETHIAA
ncbi:MAG: UDP-N-acetylmuramate--L-alanine ligase [Planctomycetota bacterium]